MNRKRTPQPSTLPDEPLSAEALELSSRLLPRIRARLSEVSRVPVSVLIWGPGYSSKSPISAVRLSLRKELRTIGHAAYFSEELCDQQSADSIRLQQLAQAQEFDLVVSLPSAPGAIAEIHDFATDRRVNGKTLVFINDQHVNGYGPQSLAAISNILSCRLERYPSERNTAIIRKVTLQEVQRIREMKYILAGRY